MLNKQEQTNSMGFSPQTTYADWSTATSSEASGDFCRQRVLLGQRNGSVWPLISDSLTGYTLNRTADGGQTHHLST
jgi:hypothetical protein